MKKLKLYLDTSVFNFALSERPGEAILKKDTNILLDKIRQGVYEGCISDQVMEEIGDAPEPKRKALLDVVNSLGLEYLVVNEEVEVLSAKYISEGLIPVKYIEDAVHIALASVNYVDAIISFNFEHMVKLKTKKGVIAVNGLMGYETIEIITPQEVDNDDNGICVNEGDTRN